MTTKSEAGFQTGPIILLARAVLLTEPRRFRAGLEQRVPLEVEHLRHKLFR